MACHLGTMTLTPVDYLARSLVSLSLRREHLGGTFHLSNGERYSSDQIFEWATEFGYEIRKVAYEDWEAAMRVASQEAAVAPMLLFLEQVAGSDVKLSDWFSNEPRIDARKTLEILAAEGIRWPRLDRELMAVYLSRFIESGYLRPPA